MRADPNTALALETLGWAKRNAKGEFSVRDLHHDMRRRVKRADDWAAPLRILEESGYLREVPIEHKKGRKPSPRYAVHPRVLEGGAS